MTVMSQTVIGVVALVALGTGLIKTISPELPRIDVHSISYAAGNITQDRTINTDKDVFRMHWTAVLLNAATGDVVPWCQGSGEFPYSAGRKAKTMTLPVWIGNAICTPESLPPGRYQPLAVYSWGDEQVIGHGEVFEVKP